VGFNENNGIWRTTIEAISVINLAFSFILDPQIRKVSAESTTFG